MNCLLLYLIKHITRPNLKWKTILKQLPKERKSRKRKKSNPNLLESQWKRNPKKSNQFSKGLFMTAYFDFHWNTRKKHWGSTVTRRAIYRLRRDSQNVTDRTKKTMTKIHRKVWSRQRFSDARRIFLNRYENIKRQNLRHRARPRMNWKHQQTIAINLQH